MQRPFGSSSETKKVLRDFGLNGLPAAFFATDVFER